MLDFRIETFITVCKTMNYTRAAELLHITQPAVSQHIHYIEQKYEIKLFSFQGKRMELTEEGSQLLNVVTTLKHDDQALQRMFKEKRMKRRQLMFGVTLTIGEYVIGEYLAHYMKKYPDTEIRLTIANTEELLRKLDAGEIDFAMVEGFFAKSNYDCQLFRKEKYVGVCAPDHKFAGKQKIYLEEIFSDTLISREQGSGTREVLERKLSAHGYDIHDFDHVIEISNMSTIKMMLTHGCGISFLYEAAVKKELETGVLVQLPAEGFPLFHDFTFIWRKNSIFAHVYQELFWQMTEISENYT